MLRTREIALVLVLLIGIGGVALAAPSLRITKPPLQPVPSWTGPLQDPHAEQGQWFQRPDGIEEVRTHEFHDNVEGHGGGKDTYHLAITGYAQNIQYAATSGNITSFDILATITNDVPALDPWQEGTNSHGESTGPREQYVGHLLDTKMTVEFAIADLATLPTSFANPYSEGEAPYIIAENEDQLAWYCWTPENEEDLLPIGDYYVPTWDFGDIAMGASSSRPLSFTVGGAGIDLNDPRYHLLQSTDDLFLNRTSSLKISDWVDNLMADSSSVLCGSDVSVFHNIPEPATLGLLGLGLGAVMSMIRRRRS